MKDLLISLRVFMFMTILLGIGYPLLMTGVAQTAFAEKASGSLITRNDLVVGSNLLSQKFVSEKYFWPRPSAGDFNPLPSGGSNLGPSSTELLKLVDERRAALQSANGAGDIPQELLFASGSGLDPEISPAAAVYQSARVAHARGLGVNEVTEIVRRNTLTPQFGILGEARVNVLALNIALDEAASGVK